MIHNIQYLENEKRKYMYECEPHWQALSHIQLTKPIKIIYNLRTKEFVFDYSSDESELEKYINKRLKDIKLKYSHLFLHI